MKSVLTLLSLSLCCALSTPASAQAYPTKPVRIVTSTPGNFHDIVARRLAQSLTERWGQPVIVENRGGAGLILAATAVAQAAPDGYTLLLADRTALAVQPSLQTKLPYDPTKDLAPITLVAAAPMLLLTERTSGADFAGFLGQLRKASAPVPMASAGPGTAPHLQTEVLKHAVGGNVLPVQYKGSPAAMTGLLAGEAKAAFVLVPVGLPHERAGKVKALAITSKQRFAGAPEIPTVRELGMPELESELWLALMAPAGTPPAIVVSIHREVVQVLADPSVRDLLIAQGATVAHSEPGELAELIRTETARWKQVITTANIKPD